MRVVIAKAGLDGHDRGAKIIARAMRDGGHEVIYTGLRRTPEQIVAIARDEDASAIGISTLSGAHARLIPTICQLLRAEGMDEVTVFVGGIIPDIDRGPLYDSGVRAIFGPGTSVNDPIRFLENVNERIQQKLPVGVGQGGTWRWS